MPDIFTNTNVYCDPGPCDITSLIFTIVAVVIGSLSIYFVIFYVLFIVACWQILKKAGEKSWKSLIPFYNMYLMFKIVGLRTWFWTMIGLSVIVSIITAVNGLIGFTIIDFNANTFDFQTYMATFITLLIFFFVNIYVLCLYCWRTSKIFGHNFGFAIGLFFLPNIFWLILAFGKSKYNKKALKQFTHLKATRK